MSLEVKDYRERRKKYIMEEGTFLLKPPYMYIVDDAQKYLDEMSNAVSQVEKLENTNDLTEVNELIKSLNDPKAAKKLITTQLKLMKLLLEETEEGKLENLKVENFRPDIFKDVINDFFQQFGKSLKIAS